MFFYLWMLASLIQQNLILSAHDVSEGGLVVTLLESDFPGELGFDVRSAQPSIRRDAYWLGESQSRVLVSVHPALVKDFKAAMGTDPYESLGLVTSGEISVDGENWGNISSWKYRYDTAIEQLLASTASEEALGTL